MRTRAPAQALSPNHVRSPSPEPPPMTPGQTQTPKHCHVRTGCSSVRRFAVGGFHSTTLVHRVEQVIWTGMAEEESRSRHVERVRVLVDRHFGHEKRAARMPRLSSLNRPINQPAARSRSATTLSASGQVSVGQQLSTPVRRSKAHDASPPPCLPATARQPKHPCHKQKPTAQAVCYCRLHRGSSVSTLSVSIGT